jgi:eukaryotic-like serine/threonine-protein kinase
MSSRTNTYFPIEQLGRGGFGIVEKVVDQLGNIFARKTFSPDSYILTNERDHLRQRFKREVLVQAELGGDQVMPVLETSLSAAAPWFLMPLAAKTFDQQIAEDRSAGGFDINAIVDILNALQFLHDRGYVHRDLNPKNVLLHEGKWKLSDFGAVLPPSGRSIITLDTGIYTEKYCSPEQRKDFHNVQASSDIYSFGCLLHDIFGDRQRIPYAQHTTSHEIGVIIEKCTDANPHKRPTVALLRELLLESLINLKSGTGVRDEKSDEWLKAFENIESWSDQKFDDFARFFSNLDTSEKTSEHRGLWVTSTSTPFLTRLTAEALKKIVNRADGVAAMIVERYCEWAGSTAFEFYFSDIICDRLIAIYDNGTPSHKANSFCALAKLGDTHNRWYIMRSMINRCRKGSISDELAQRLKIELKVSEMDHHFRRCVAENKTDKSDLMQDLAGLCW